MVWLELRALFDTKKVEIFLEIENKSNFSILNRPK